MTTKSPPSPVPYRVVYSGLVRTELTALLGRARDAGHGQEALAAIKEIDYRLKLYPQFGEPLRDLKTPGETSYAGTVNPLFVEYIIDEPLRTVFVIVPIKALPHVGFQ
jgi:hypothetical protein